MQKTISLLMFLIALILPGCSESAGLGDPDDAFNGKKPPYFKGLSNDVVLTWNRTAQELMAGPTYNCLVATRALSMMHLAMHDALNNVGPTYETYAFNEPDKKADPIAAISSAAHTVLISLYPEKMVELNVVLADAVGKVKNADALQRGLVLGRSAGEAIIALRANDDPLRDPIGEINNPVEPGRYQPVPPMPFLYAPFWKDMKPFSLETPAQFRIAPQPALTSNHYTKDFNEVKQKGALNSANRSAEETAIAKYWYELSEIGWNRIAQNVAADQKLDVLTTTRLFALVNVALADAYIAGWDSKFHYDFWRPYSAIRAAETDGNGATSADANWEPLMTTPPVQDYPSTHSALGNAAAVVLTEIVGNNIPFGMASPTAEPVNSVRSFKNFYEASRENAESRILAGIHFRFSCEKGLELGEKIGLQIMDTKLRPLTAKKNL